MVGVCLAFLALGVVIGSGVQWLVDKAEVRRARKRYLKMRDKYIEVAGVTIEIVNEDFKRMKDQKKFYEVQAQELAQALKSAEFSIGVYKKLAHGLGRKGVNNNDMAELTKF